MPLRGNHYEVLGLGPHATPEQIEKAFRFAEEMYGGPSLAVYSLLDPGEMDQVRSRIREAYEVLRDPARRLAYDRSFGEGDGGAPRLPLELPPPRYAEPPAAAPFRPPSPAPPRLEVLPEPVTGEALRRRRQERGVALAEIAAASKVGVRVLEYIEADRHALLPAPVYLRGFLQEYARLVGLDPRRTAEAYLARVPRTD